MKIDQFTYFYPEKPGLLFIEQALIGIMAANPAWIAELKYNGSRLCLHRLPSGKWELWNRHGEKFSFTPNPELAAALEELNRRLEPGKYYLFDGELRHNKTVGVRQKIVIYDCFIFGGELLTGVPFRSRRGILETLEKAGGFSPPDPDFDPPLSIPYQFPDHFDQVFYEVIQDPEIEGLVMKNLTGVLNLGRKSGVNSAWMMKVRRPSNSYKF